MYDRDTSTLFENIGPSLPAPRRADELLQTFESLAQSLREQAGRSDVHLPPDFKEVMSLVDGIFGAGVPSENCHLRLIWGAKMQGKCADLHRARRHLQFDDVVARWETGGSNWENRLRQILYVICRPSETEDGPLQWKIVDCEGFNTEDHT